MKGTILLVSLAVLAFKNVFHNDDQAVTDTTGTAVYIHAHYAKVESGLTSDRDTSFLAKAIEANQHEIMMAQMAMQRSSSPEVKSVAQKLISDHTQLLQQLQGLKGSNTDSTTRGNYSDSTGVNAMYNNISGITFDRQWVGEMIAGHQKTLSDFRAELAQANDANLKTVINNALPVIQDHLKQLQILRGKMM
jgi:putative membrane protein